MYWPLRYIETIKRPGKRYIWRSVLQEDYAFWVLAASWISPMPVVHAAGLLLVLLSFWALYEHGYAENDWAAYHFEGQYGKVPRGAAVAHPPREWPPWLWALGLVAPGTLLLTFASGTTGDSGNWIAITAGWLALLAATRSCYWVYNRLAPVQRVWFYPLLQMCRAFGVLAVAAINPIGAFILAAHVIARSLPYIRYRLLYPGVRSSWPDMNIGLSRFFFFMGLWLAWASITGDPGLVLEPQALLIALWCIVRARTEITQLVRRPA